MYARNSSVDVDSNIDTYVILFHVGSFRVYLYASYSSFLLVVCTGNHRSVSFMYCGTLVEFLHC